MNWITKIPNDKLLHMLVGLIIYDISRIIIKPILSLYVALLISFGIVVIVAVGKEISDKRHPKKHTASLMDIYATISLPLLLLIIELLNITILG